MPPFDKLLILDIDETLIHGDEQLGQPADFTVGPYGIVRRPGVARFLEFALEGFREVAVWTSATLGYAEAVLDQLLDRRRLVFVWGRERCVRSHDPESGDVIWRKDINKLRKRWPDRGRILFVDDSPEKIARSYGNLVKVAPFLGAPADDELLWLERYLRELGPVPNVRTVEKRGWRARLRRNCGNA